jgi:predicted amidohydrolase
MNESRRGGPFRVALIQVDSRTDREKNLKKAEEKIREAQAAGAKFVVLPETVEYIGPDMDKHAVDHPEKLVDYFGHLACELGIFLHCGSITEMSGEGKPRNTSFLFDPSGKCVARYSKVHLFDVNVTDGPSYRESDSIQAGEGVTLAETELGNMGLAICYDIRFPELFRILAEEGAELFVVAANFTKETGVAHWEALLRTRAIENTCYVLACNQCGKKAAFEAYGHSMIIDPWGTVLAQAGDEETIIYADLDLNEVKKVRREMPSLGNVRKDLYELRRFRS